MSLDMAEFGRFINDVREQANISALELGKMAGISTVQNITRIERNKVTNPTYDTVERIMTAISQLDIIKNKEFCFDNYSQSLVDSLNRFCLEKDKVSMDKPVANEIPDGFNDISKQDAEMAVAIIALLKEYPIFRDELLTLCDKVDRIQQTCVRVDFASVISELTERGNTTFYFGLNEKIRQFVKSRSYAHAYEFMAMVVKAINDNFVEKDGQIRSVVEQQRHHYRRRTTKENGNTPSP